MKEASIDAAAKGACLRLSVSTGSPPQDNKEHHMTTLRKFCAPVVGAACGWLMALSSALVVAGPPAASAPQGRFTEVNGVRLHYRIAGQGNPVVLLHGYTQTSHMWKPIMGQLAKTHTVIVPDMRGVGGSEKAAGGYLKTNMAKDIHEMVGTISK